ncbi:hypothetical protein, partial [Streptosporangium sandarakinum]|uniref:hypothetical protein n=1 Tax=Streptosporangium sandarakinum TaxID=1260955 RepID=UPI0033ADD4BD
GELLQQPQDRLQHVEGLEPGHHQRLAVVAGDWYVTPGRSPAEDLLDLFGVTAPAGRAAEPERSLAAWLAGEEGWTYAA